MEVKNKKSMCKSGISAELWTMLLSSDNQKIYLWTFLTPCSVKMVILHIVHWRYQGGMHFHCVCFSKGFFFNDWPSCSLYFHLVLDLNRPTSRIFPAKLKKFRKSRKISNITNLLKNGVLNFWRYVEPFCLTVNR